MEEKSDKYAHVEKNVSEQAVGTRNKVHSFLSYLLISFLITSFSHFLWGLKNVGSGYGTMRKKKKGGDAVSWWRKGESRGWGEVGAGDSFWSLPRNKSVRARQKESRVREREREMDLSAEVCTRWFEVQSLFSFSPSSSLRRHSVDSTRFHVPVVLNFVCMNLEIE